ncbi:efflux RND transporter permease subunit [Candidatus Manganitrophus noduliformans]|uniref:Multidrug efflux protein n=1 Tax=Candidatus Manganitrophus noduliformans TaxID=2606439 RepID=A0A7X6IBI1_9BACT|nr:efflux RND transporter permease subunit [Candidatus Manganitrophus noduliformans]NKE71663.1 multidrug efflux protein [Candidatus Manganitrophus noduliformans]
MKGFTDIFVRRPVLAIVVNVLIIIAGLQAWKTLSVRQYPRSENASVTIATVYIGASADVVRGFITTAIERSIASADGIDYVESKSLLGLSLVTARLKLNYDATRALADITAKVNQVRNELPAEAEVPSISVQSADSEFAAAYLSFASDALTQSEITDYVVRAIQPRLASLAGVQKAEIIGARTFAMRVWLKPAQMAALNVSPAQIRAALAANNFLAAVGNTKGAFVQVNLTANTDLHTVEEFKQLVIRRENDTIVRLQDVADVEMGAEDYDTEVRFTGQTAIFIGIFPLPHANTIDVVERVRAELDSIRRDLPKGLEGRVAYDASEYISSAIHEVLGTLTETLIIVVIVIFFFLGSFRSALVPILAIPVSLIGSVFLMQSFGFTLNLLTLLAIVLSVGLVVDDAIVVVENVERHLREGRTPFQAALVGARELIGPVIAMTITLAAVYTPIGLQGGFTGALFREFALTLAGAVTISGIVALTLSPMMAAKLLRGADREERGFTGWINHRFDRLRRGYGGMLDRTMRARPAVYTVWIALSLLTVPMYLFSPKELAPVEDQGFMFGIINNAANASADQKSHFGRAAEQAFLSTPERDVTFQILMSPSDPFAAAMGVGGFSGMVVKPWEQRDRSISQILPEVQGKLSAIPGLQIFAARPPALPGGGNFPVEFIIASTAEPERMLEAAQQLQMKAMESGLFYFPPEIDLKYDQPQSEIVIDHQKVATLGLNNAQIGADLGAALGGDYVNRFNIAGRAYKVIPQIARADRLNPDQLKEIYVTGPDNRLIPLSAIATIRDGTVPRSLNRFQQMNAIKLSGMTAQLDEGLKVLENAARDILPPGYTINYTGESRQLRTEGGKFLPALGLAILLIFLVLAVQFNSFRDPLVILLGSVPLAMFGALIFTVLKMPNPDLPYWTDGWTTTMNIYAQVGLVTLVGLVAKNGILIVEFANKLQEGGADKRSAVKEAAMTRLRPVLMTSVATVAGHFPLTLVSGPGAAARNSIGLVLVGGMIIGTIFTLFVVPSLYMLMAKQHHADRTAAPQLQPVEAAKS